MSVHSNTVHPAAAASGLSSSHSSAAAVRGSNGQQTSLCLCCVARPWAVLLNILASVEPFAVLRLPDDSSQLTPFVWFLLQLNTNPVVSCFRSGQKLAAEW